MKKITCVFLILAMAIALALGASAAPAAEEALHADTIGYAAEVVRLVNVERTKTGASAVSAGNSKLNAAAQKRAEELVTTFSHTRPDGSSCFTAMDDFGVTYSYAGENIAWGQADPSAVMNSWMNSSGHKANILNSNYNKIGVGVYQYNGRIYWVQLFAFTDMEDDVDPTTPTTPTPPTNPMNPTTPTNPTNPTNPTSPTSALAKIWEFIAAYIIPIFIGGLQFIGKLFLIFL